MHIPPVRSGVLALSALVIAACGGTPAASGPAVPTVPPINLPSIALPSIPPIDIPSIALPSIPIVPDQSLESLFPDDIAGNALTIQSAQGPSVVTLFSNDPARFNEFLSSIGATVDQVSGALSFNLWPGPTQGDFTGLTISALQVRGKPAAETITKFQDIVKRDVENATIGSATIGGKNVVAIANPDKAEETVYLYPYNDIVFLVGGTPSHVEEALSKLP